jgi:hypothetical protein
MSTPLSVRPTGTSSGSATVSGILALRPSELQLSRPAAVTLGAWLSVVSVRQVSAKSKSPGGLRLSPARRHPVTIRFARSSSGIFETAQSKGSVTVSPAKLKASQPRVIRAGPLISSLFHGITADESRSGELRAFFHGNISVRVVAIADFRSHRMEPTLRAARRAAVGR